MRILMRNTVFKTATLTGLFACMLALGGGVFSGITTSVHALTAEKVQTEADLEQFVKAAIDEYYINTIIKTCDFTSAPFSSTVEALIDLATAPVDQIKPLIPSFPLVGLTGRSDLDPYCDFSQRFDQVFGRTKGEWKSGSIYLFVIDDEKRLLFSGIDSPLEGNVLDVVDAAGNDVGQAIVDEVKTPGNDSLVDYCWDDPTTTEDDTPGSGMAPGDSWKVSYVVDPFEYLGATDLSADPSVIFGAGIYPKTGTPPSGCRGGDMADMDGTGDMEDEIIDEIVSAVTGGGCAIAAGSGDTPRGTIFNLLLIVSALVFTISFRSRVMDKRSGFQS